MAPKRLAGISKMLFAWIKGHNYELTPVRYVGAEETEADNMPFEERFAALNVTLGSQFTKAELLMSTIQTKMKKVVVNE